MCGTCSERLGKAQFSHLPSKSIAAADGCACRQACSAAEALGMAKARERPMI